MRRASPPFFLPSITCMYTRRSPSCPGSWITSITWHLATTLDPGIVMAPSSTSTSMPANLSAASEWESPNADAMSACDLRRLENPTRSPLAIILPVTLWEPIRQTNLS